MAVRPATEARLDWAIRQLLACRGPSQVVADLAEREGISRRQARRIVGSAYQQLQEDLTEAGIDRQQMAAQLAHGLMEAVGIALEQKHPSAVAGCAAQLQNLLGLGVAAQQRLQQ